MSPRPLSPLTELEARVLAVLVEKQHTVPDTYPLSLNAVVAGCNQKTSRDPVIQASESGVQGALDSLRHRSLVIESSGGRVMRYAQNAKRVLEVPSEAVALLATLMLRGPQTAGELRINCERLHRFSDISAVEGYLNELAERPAGALVAELPRQPGSRENRWAHLLCGARDDAAASTTAAGAAEDPERPLQPSRPTIAGCPPLPGTTLDAEVARLAAQLDRLESQVASLQASLEQLLAERDAGR
jgi:uncharacterized protein